MNDNENLIEIYNRTYQNCRFYQSIGDEKALLNEIGVLRGIMYCIDISVKAIGVYGDNMIDVKAFRELIDEQQRLLGR